MLKMNRYRVKYNNYLMYVHAYNKEAAIERSKELSIGDETPRGSPKVQRFFGNADGTYPRGEWISVIDGE